MAAKWCSSQENQLQIPKALTRSPLSGSLAVAPSNPNSSFHYQTAHLVNKLTSIGCKVKIWIADWFAQLNNKMRADEARNQHLATEALSVNITFRAIWCSIEVALILKAMACITDQVDCLVLFVPF
ncbi:hypothetical protein E3N88_25857 [Mikania micrantha]|uniref:tyrosine--tRNA ligase n=1 Tax=Mikania micrantha TaxID=192012 RepID=A0A5N6N8Q0_9ASTR|nr:hypothetical protein E3N88_25857 [Mikania micrantha]